MKTDGGGGGGGGATEEGRKRETEEEEEEEGLQHASSNEGRGRKGPYRGTTYRLLCPR